MSITLQHRRGTESQNDNFTGAQGEIVVDTTTNSLRVHDGVSTGGKVIGSINVPTRVNFPASALDGQISFLQEYLYSGVFEYDSTRSTENDGMDVFNGWVRKPLLDTYYDPNSDATYKINKVFGVIRNDGDQSDDYNYFKPITTSGHTPIGFKNPLFTGAEGVIKSVETGDTYVSVWHDVGNDYPGGRYVGYAVANLDETFAKTGLRVGTSVGTNETRIFFYRDIFYNFTANAGVISLFTPSFDVDTITWNATGYFDVTHKECINPVITPSIFAGSVGFDYILKPSIISDTNTRLYLYKMPKTISGYISYNGSAFAVSGDGEISLGAFSAGTLPVTWTSKVSNYALSISSRGVYLAKLDSSNDFGTEIEWYDAAGSLVATADTNMKAYFMAQSELTPVLDISGINMSMGVTHKSGSSINPKNIEYIAGSNVWFNAYVLDKIT